MGPRPFGRGRHRRYPRRPSRIRASMGPRPFGRGRVWCGYHAAPCIQASMGPRPFGRGRCRGPCLQLAGARRFNGAATFRSRKARIAEFLVHTCGTLQWGRDLSVAEGQPARDIFPATQRASMGPRPFGRGRLYTELGEPDSELASMGPRPFGRGRRSRKRVQTATSKLQWGRDLSVAEGAHPEFPGLRHGVASMGPRPFGRGRRGPARVGPYSRMCFNGAATFRSRKGGRRREYPLRPVKLQWGRDLSVAEGEADL